MLLYDQLKKMISLLWCIFTVESNCKIVTEERGLQDICAAMMSHEACADLIESACSALWSLSMEGEIDSILYGELSGF